jgi:hypothetical protein
MPMIDQRMSIVIRPDDLLDARLSHPDWDQVQINDSYGKIRDYRRACEARENRKDLGKIQEQGWVDDEAKRVLNPTNGYDESGRRLYHKHANHTPKEGRALLAVGNGNLLSNLGIVGWSERTSNEADSRLWKVAWEDRRIDSGWEYSCFYVTEDLSTGVARFGLKGGTVQTSEDIHGKLKWVTSGQRGQPRGPHRGDVRCAPHLPAADDRRDSITTGTGSQDCRRLHPSVGRPA